jgi:hypothetical protein
MIGAKVPAYVVGTSSGSQQCETGTAHQDPCTTMNIRGHRVTIAWDQQTKAVTYLFTDDRRLVGDSELGVGGSGRIAGDGGRGDSRLIKYQQWLVTKTGGKASGNGLARRLGTRRWMLTLQILAALRSSVSCRVATFYCIDGFIRARNRPHV